MIFPILCGRRTIQVLALPLLMAAGCSSGGAKGASGGPAPAPVPTAPTYKTIAAMLFEPKCVRCHSGPTPRGGVTLDNYDALIAPTAEGEHVVSPSKPDDSLLMKVLTARTAQDDPPPMPPEGPRVDDATVATVRDWIAAGAPQ